MKELVIQDAHLCTQEGIKREEIAHIYIGLISNPIANTIPSANPYAKSRSNKRTVVNPRQEVVNAWKSNFPMDIRTKT